MKKMILFLLLSQAAQGICRMRPASKKEEPGLFENYNKATRRYETYEYDMETGVSIADLIEHKDAGNAYAYVHINFTESEIEKCITTLKQNDLSGVLKPINNKNEIRFEIKHEDFRTIIGMCEAIIYYVMLRIEKEWLKKDSRPTRGTRFQWYASLFGEKTIDVLFKRAKFDFDMFV